MKTVIIGSLLVLSALLIWYRGNTETTQPTSQESANTLAPSGEEAPTRIFALGDSLTAGYQLDLEESYPAQLEVILQSAGYTYTVINAGKSGDTSAGLFARLKWLMEDAQSGDIALLVIGANDGLQSLPLTQFQTNLEEIVATLLQRDITLVLGGMQLPTNLNPTYREQFANIYRDIAQEQDIFLIDFFLENVAAIPELNLADGIHPNATGYNIIAQQTANYLIQQGIIQK